MLLTRAAEDKDKDDKGGEFELVRSTTPQPVICKVRSLEDWLDHGDDHFLKSKTTPRTAREAKVNRMVLNTLRDIAVTGGPESSVVANTALLSLSRNGGSGISQGKMLRRLLRVRENEAGPKSLSAAAVMSVLGPLLQQMGHLDEAQGLVERALAVYEDQWPDHPAVMLLTKTLGRNLVSLHREIEAEPILRRHLHLCRERSASPKQVADALILLGILLRRLGSSEEACLILQECLEICETVHGRMAKCLAHVYSNLGLALHGANELLASVEMLRLALEIRITHFGEAHLCVAHSCHDLALVLKQNGNIVEAISLLSRCIAICDREEEMEGNADHVMIGRVACTLGILLQSQGRLAQARPYLQRSFDIQLDLLGPLHEQTALAAAQLSVLMVEQGQTTAEREFASRFQVAQDREASSMTAHGLSTLRNQIAQDMFWNVTFWLIEDDELEASTNALPHPRTIQPSEQEQGSLSQQPLSVKPVEVHSEPSESDVAASVNMSSEPELPVGHSEESAESLTRNADLEDKIQLPTDDTEAVNQKATSTQDAQTIQAEAVTAVLPEIVDEPGSKSMHVNTESIQPLSDSDEPVTEKKADEKANSSTENPTAETSLEDGVEQKSEKNNGQDQGPAFTNQGADETEGVTVERDAQVKQTTPIPRAPRRKEGGAQRQRVSPRTRRVEASNEATTDKVAKRSTVDPSVIYRQAVRRHETIRGNHPCHRVKQLVGPRTPAEFKTRDTAPMQGTKLPKIVNPSSPAQGKPMTTFNLLQSLCSMRKQVMGDADKQKQISTPRKGMS